MQITVPGPEGCKAVGIEQATMGITGQAQHTITVVCGDRGPVTSVYEPNVGLTAGGSVEASPEQVHDGAYEDLAVLVGGMCLNCPNRSIEALPTSVD